MLVFPEFDPVAVSLGPVKIHWYGLMYVLAFLCAYGLATYRTKTRDGWTPEMVSDLLFYGALGVILGGRIGYVLFYEFDKFLADPIWLFQVWTGGMSFHGGFLGVIIAMVFFARKYQKTAFQTLDFIAPCVPTGLFFGRIGNFIGGELVGRPVENLNYPLAMIFPHVDQIPRHPSQLYQALGEGILLFIVLWWFSSRPRPRMAVSAVFLMGYGLTRFFVEFFREPDIDQGFILFGWVTKGQLLSFPMILAGLWLLWYAYRRKIYDWGPQKNN
ncbi:prolipoprotein diacylglyceryl transferase [Alkanindiges sp. WGS2144]|uniref:prolipoprotein diacylglyceryl transferase n=1 Tax=Alkanindiges sp. WGS2144 TaxID=3366808 RepID=UPI0037517F93